MATATLFCLASATIIILAIDEQYMYMYMQGIISSKKDDETYMYTCSTSFRIMIKVEAKLTEAIY